MKKTASITYSTLIMASLLLGCRDSVKNEYQNSALANTISLGQKYRIQTNESVITWNGNNLMGSNSHTGYVYISKGELMIENGQLVGGTAQVDMNAIEEENHDRESGLVKHLKDPDFFDVKRFPIATIVITKVTLTSEKNINVTGNLTIKGITHPVAFPVKLNVKDSIVKMNGELIIDRTIWDIRYKSGKFYALLADQTISDFIEFRIKIVAKK